MFSILIYSALIQLNVFNFHLEGVVFGVIPCLYHRLYATPRSLLAAPSARSARTPRLLLEDSEGRRRDRAHQEGRSKYQMAPAFDPNIKKNNKKHKTNNKKRKENQTCVSATP